MFYTADVLWVLVWAIIGSILGFFSIRNKPEWLLKDRLIQLALSVSMGMFFALPMYIFLIEEHKLSNRLSILLAGSIAFCISDIIISLWQKLKELLLLALEKLITVIIDRLKK